MKKLIKGSIVLVMAALFTAGHLAAFDLTVTVNDDNANPISGAQVMALTFGLSNEPNPELSNTGYTDNAGQIAFALDNSRNYTIVATKDDYSPSLKYQVETDSTPVVIIGSAEAQSCEISLAERADADSYCTVKADVIISPVYAPTIIFGSVMAGSSAEDKNDIAFGVMRITDTVNGRGTLEINNVSNNETGDYEIGCFSPQMNTGYGQPISISTSDTGTVSLNPDLDLTSTDANIAEGTVEQEEYTDENTGELIKGIVYDDENRAVGNTEVRVWFEYEYSYLMDGTTYYNHEWRDYSGWTDSYGNYSIYSDVDFSKVINISGFNLEARGNGYLSKSTAIVDTAQLLTDIKSMGTVVRQDFKGPIALKKVIGEISGRLLLGGSSLGNGHINVNGDWSAWLIEGSTYIYTDRSANSWNEDNVNSSGEFSIGGLAPGNYRLEVWTEFSSDGYVYNKGENGENDTFSGEVMFQDEVRPNNEIHEMLGDDLRINLSTDNIVTVYSSTGAVVSTGLIDINLPAKEVSGSSMTLTGSVVLNNVASLEAPVSIIVHEKWDSFDRNQEVTEEIAVSSDPFNGDFYLKLSHNRVSPDGVQELYKVGYPT
ncbi:MAG: hypothetical protein PF545_01705, partial [Elusimicrobia bacterium]|nr:hypothetical protein [Elusimicrobiota bacterium]